MNIPRKNIRQLDILVDDVEREGQRTDRLFKKLPSEFHTYSPSENLLHAGLVIEHIAMTYLSLSKVYRGEDWDTFKFQKKDPSDNIEAAVSFLSRSRQEAIAAATACPLSRLQTEVAPFELREPEPTINFLQRAVDHEIHHRGELCVYATLFGFAVGDIFQNERKIVS